MFSISSYNDSMSVDSNNIDNDNNKRCRSDTAVINIDSDVDEEDQSMSASDEIQKDYVDGEGQYTKTDRSDEMMTKRKMSFVTKMFIDLKSNFTGGDGDKGKSEEQVISPDQLSSDVLQTGEVDLKNERKRSFATRFFSDLRQDDIGDREKNSTGQNVSIGTIDEETNNHLKEVLGNDGGDGKQRRKSFASRMLTDIRNSFTGTGDTNERNIKTGFKIENVQTTNLNEASNDKNEIFFKGEQKLTSSLSKEKGQAASTKSKILPELKDIGHILVKSGKTSLTSPLPPLKLTQLKKSSKTSRKHKSSNKDTNFFSQETKSRKPDESGLKNDRKEINATMTLKIQNSKTYDVEADSVFEPRQKSTLNQPKHDSNENNEKEKQTTLAIQKRAKMSESDVGRENDNITKILISETFDENADLPVVKETTVETPSEKGLPVPERDNYGKNKSIRTRSPTDSHASRQPGLRPTSQFINRVGNGNRTNSTKKVIRDRSQTLLPTTTTSTSSVGSRNNQQQQASRSRSSTFSNTINSSKEQNNERLASRGGKRNTTRLKTAFLTNNLEEENLNRFKDPTKAVKNRSGTIEITVDCDDENNVSEIFSRHNLQKPGSANFQNRTTNKNTASSIRKISKIQMYSAASKKKW